MAGLLQKTYSPEFIKSLSNITDKQMRCYKILLEGSKKATTKQFDVEIIADFLSDSIAYLTECGYSWDLCSQTLSFICQLLLDSKSLALNETVGLIRQRTLQLTAINPNQINFLLEYLHKSYLQHYSLYQYLLTTPQQMDYTHLVKEVYTPEEFPDLNQGTDEAQWKYEQVVRDIHMQHTASIEELKRSAPCPSPPPVMPDQGKVEKEMVAPMISKYIGKVCERVEKDLEFNLQLTELVVGKEIAILEASKMRKSTSTTNSDKSRFPSSSSRGAVPRSSAKTKPPSRSK